MPFDKTIRRENQAMTVIPAIDEEGLEHEWTQRTVREIVRLALESPLREPILEAVQEADGKTNSEEMSSRSRRAMVRQGATVFFVMFVAMYLALRKPFGKDA